MPLDPEPSGLACVALGIVLTACGGGGTSEPEAAPVTQQATQACVSTVRVQLFGDSTQAGWSAEQWGIVQNRPAVVLQSEMDAAFGAGVVKVQDRAVSSTTLAEMMAGADGLNAPWPGSVDADIVVVNHGINDATRYGGAGLPEYQSRLDALAARLPAGTQLVLQTSNPVTGWDLAPYAQAMREVAAQRGAVVADTFGYVSNLPGTGHLSDWAHPTQAMYSLIARHSLAPAVAPLVRARVCR
jgi:lysophospholipase L1-like esterase